MVAVNTRASGRQPRAFHLSDNPVGELVWRELGTDLGDRRIRQCASVGEQEGRHHQVSSVGLGDDDGGIWIGLLEPYAVSAPCRCEERHLRRQRHAGHNQIHSSAIPSHNAERRRPRGNVSVIDVSAPPCCIQLLGQDQQQTFEVPERLSATMVT
jgi:hypothetical protein